MKMKRLIAVMLSLLLLIGNLPQALAAEDGFELVLSDAQARAGEEFSVTVSVRNNPGFAGFFGEIRYDSAVMELLSGTNENIGGSWDLSTLSTDGLFSWSDTKNYTADGTILTLSFRMKSDAKYESEQNHEVSIYCDPSFHGVFSLDASEALNFLQTKGSVTVLCTHEPVTVPGKAAGCTESGLTDGKKCAVCQFVLEEQQLINPTHLWGSTQYLWSEDHSSCTAMRACSRVASHTETAQGSVSSVVISKPTCESTGHSAFTATFDEDWASTQTETAATKALGHSWGIVSYEWSKDHSMCTARHFCTRDSRHSETATATVSSRLTTTPLCESEGLRSYTASFTESWAASQTAEETVGILSHSWGAPSYAWSEDYRSCTATRTCTRDSRHSETATATVSTTSTAAACGQSGSVSYTASFAESWASTQSKTVNTTALEHEWGSVSYSWSEDYSSCTAKRVCVRDASHVETAKATVSSILTTAPLCESEGLRSYTASFTESWATTQTAEEKLGALSHSWGVPSYEWSEDNSRCTATRTCTRDSRHSETAAATVSTTSTAAACGQSGSVSYTASFAESWAQNQSVTAQLDALPHVWGETEYSWSKGYSSCRATRTCQTDASHVETALAVVSSETTLAPSCEKSGIRTYTAAFQPDWAESQTLERTLAALEHEWGEVSYSWSEDYSRCTASRSCIHDADHVQSLTALGSETIEAPADCETGAKLTYTAIFDTDWAESRRITVVSEPLSHRWGGTEYIWSDGYSRCTAVRRCLNNSNHRETAVGELSHTASGTEACGEHGGTIHEASFTVDWAEKQYAIEQKDCGHKWVFDHTECDSLPYVNVFRCTGCSETRRETVLTPKATALTLDSGTAATVYINDNEPLTIHASVLPENAAQGVSWTGMNSAYAMFEQQGNDLVIRRYTGKTGTLSLTATATDGSRVKATVKLSFARYAEKLRLLDASGNSVDSLSLSGKSSYAFKTDLAADKTVSDKTVVWALSSEDYASVDKNGKLTVKSFAGEAQTVVLSATAKNNSAATDSVELTLLPNLQQSVEILWGDRVVNNAAISCELSEGSVQLALRSINLTAPATFESSKSAVATVDSRGKVRLRSGGSTTITVSCGGVESRVTLNVVDSVQRILVSGSETLLAGKSATYKATTVPAVPTNKSISWSLAPGDEAYATMKNGKLTARKTLGEPVTVSVIARSSDGKIEGTMAVTLVPAATAVVLRTAAPATADMSEHIHLCAQVQPMTAGQSVKWSSSNKLYSIDENGDITALPGAKAGNVSFTATATDGSGKKLTVKIRFVHRMTEEELSFPESATLTSGKTLTLKAVVGKDVTNKKLLYTMAENPYADMKNGKVTAAKTLTKPVNVVVTVTAADGSGVSKSCCITLYPAATAVVIENVPGRSLILGESYTLYAATVPSGAAQSVKWTSSNKLITIDENGRITALPGAKSATVTFTATATDGSGKKASVKIDFVGDK